MKEAPSTFVELKAPLNLVANSLAYYTGQCTILASIPSVLVNVDNAVVYLER